MFYTVAWLFQLPCFRIFVAFRSARLLIFFHFDLSDIVICALRGCGEARVCGGVLVGRGFFSQALGTCRGREKR